MIDAKQLVDLAKLVTAGMDTTRIEEEWKEKREAWGFDPAGVDELADLTAASLIGMALIGADLRACFRTCFKVGFDVGVIGAFEIETRKAAKS